MALDLSRRHFLRGASLSVGVTLSGWLGRLATATAKERTRKRACILLWMNGGPSQMDTFDLKPGHNNGGPFKETTTAVPGIKISEHLPKIADRMKHVSIVRSMTSKEGDHGLATFLNHTGYSSRGPIRYPSIGSTVSKELGSDDAALPNFVSIAPFRAFNPAAHGPGFLGPRYAPLIVGESTFGQQQSAATDASKALQVEDLALPGGIKADRFDARWELAAEFQRDFAASRPDPAARSHQTAYERASRLMRSATATALKLDDEPARLRDAYGRNVFGQGCLLARRLVEGGVPFVEVSLGGAGGVGWDTHTDNFERVKTLSKDLDAGWSALMDDLKDRGLLDSTLIVWMGEFGRTPKINGSSGRDHFPYAWTAALSGGGVKGGQAVGRTSNDGMTVEDRPVSVPTLLATVCKALGIDPDTQNISNTGRPIPIAENGTKAVDELLA
jgi:uncharacterized protein (DUF1501 family)